MTDSERDGLTRPMVRAGSVDPPARLAPAFQVGDRIAGRYVIHALLGSGGMGEVYEVEDEQLHERIALKCVRAAALADDGTAEQFKQEIRLARKVTHPAVCRVFDLGSHALPSGQELLFLTMEVLRGQSLLDRVRDGPLPMGEAAAIARQVTAGLGAAHSAGIIHRDLKSANVMLVGASQPWRAVITDFGLAGERTTNSAGEAMVGTPAYMAPEQVEGKPLSAATDLYALGCVLFELVTGQVPFVSNRPWETALMRLRAPAPSPRTLRPDLPDAWERAILACLERRPDRRPESPDAVLELLQPRRTRSARWLAAAGLALAAALAGALGWGSHRMGRRAAEAGGPRPSIAVIPFAEPAEAGGAGWLGTAASEMLTSELEAGDQLRVPSGDAVGQAVSELGLAAAANGLPSGALTHLREQLSVDEVVTGSIRHTEGPHARLRVEVAVQDAKTGRTQLTLQEEAGDDELGALLARMAGRIAGELGVALPRGSDEPGGGLSRVLPQSPAAREAYFEAEAAFHRFDLGVARERSQAAIEGEPGHALSHALLSQILLQLFDEDGARREAQRAFELSGSLPREQKLLIKARKHLASTEWPEAIATFRSLFDFFPDNLDYGLGLARAQNSAGRYGDAVATLALLRTLPAPLGTNPGIDLATSDVLLSQGKATLALPLLASVIERAHERGQASMEIDALIHQAEGLEYLNHPDQAVGSGRKAVALARALGDRAREASALRTVALALNGDGDLRASAETDRQMLTIARELKSETLQALALDDLSWALGALGRFDEATRAAEQAAELFRALHLPDASLAEITLGMLDRWRGKLPEAQRQQQQVLSDLKGSAEESGIMGGWARYELGLTLLRMNQLTAARESLEKSLEIRRALTGPLFVAESLAALAEVALALGQTDDALKLSGEALQKLTASGEHLRTAPFFAARARALLARGDVAGASAAADEAVSRAGPVPTAMAWAARLAHLEVQARAEGPTPGWIAQVEALRDEERSLGFQLDGLDADALLWRLQASGHKADAAQKARLIAGARDLGYERLAAVLAHP